MAERVGCLLRMRPEVKEAAEGLRSVRFIEMQPGSDKSIWAPSVNAALLHFVEQGIRATLPRIDAQIDAETEEVKVWEEMMTWLVNNPAARSILPSNLPEGSRARAWMEEEARVDPGAWHDGVFRTDAASEYARHQQRLFDLIDVKG